jgi:prepilin-type N-terminal cleavage/methylation domain-containing protein
MKRGFTLIELLVVMAIIAILAAVLIPVVEKAQGAAKKANCINNLGQINKAVLMYADDHADAIRGVTNGDEIYFTYKDSLGPYLSRSGASTNDALFTCPADDFNCDDPKIQAVVPVGPLYGTGFYRQATLHNDSYFFNGSASDGDDPRAAKPFSQVRQPAQLVMAAEISGALGLSAHARKQPYQFRDAMNVLSFVDGHVAYLRIYWNGNVGSNDIPVYYNPGPGYDYEWMN